MDMKIKAIVSATLATVIAMSTFVGCSSKTPNEGTSSTASTASTTDKKGIELPYTGEEIVFKGFGYDGLPQEDTLCSRAWKDHIGNIRIEWEMIPYSDYQTKTQVFLASGDIPDVLPVEGVQKVVQTFSGEGTFLDFNKYTEYMPNLQKYRENYPSMDLVNTKEGNRYAIYGVQPIDFSGESWMVNMDTLKKAGIDKAPSTLDEMLVAMRAVKKAIPDSVPFQSYWNLGYTRTWFTLAMGAKTDGLVYYDTADKTFKSVYREPSAKRKEVTQLLADMYKEGLINSEIETMSFEQETNSLAQGNWAFTALYSNSLEKEIFKVEAGKALPFDIQPLTPPAGAEGKRYLPLAYQHDSAPGWGIVCSSGVKNPEFLAKYMDEVVSPFGRDLFNYGVEGETYDKVDGQYVMKKDVDLAKAGVSTQYEVWMVGMGPTVRTANGFLLQQSAIDNNHKGFMDGSILGSFSPTNTTFTTEDAEKKANIENTFNTFIKENEAKFIYGLRDMSEWDKYLEELEKIASMDDLLAIYNNADTVEKDKNRIFEVKE